MLAAFVGFCCSLTDSCAVPVCVLAPVLQPCLRNGAVEPWQAMGVVKAAMRGAPYDRLVAAATVRVSAVCVGSVQAVCLCAAATAGHDRGLCVWQRR